MTSLLRLSGLTAITLAAALSMTAGLAIAGDNVSADQIVNALQPKPVTRGLKRFLVDQYGINGIDLVTVGYGKDKPKDPNAPMDPTNRRVQAVNMDTRTALK